MISKCLPMHKDSSLGKKSYHISVKILFWTDMNLDKRLIIIFVKLPYKGNVKNRLASAIGDDAAVSLYKAFVYDLLENIKITDCDIRIFYYPSESINKIERWLGKNFNYKPQIGNDLGERMKNAFIESFSEGFEKVIIIGSDMPDLPLSIIEEAFTSLNQNNAVIGPSFDGGYYLIGFRKNFFIPEIFQNIQWGSEGVFQKSIEMLQNKGISRHFLPKRRDIDTLEDLISFFQEHTNTDPERFKTMSLILKNKIILNRAIK